MKKKTKAVICSIILILIIAGGYVGNMFGIFNSGNYGDYSPDNVPCVSDSPIRGKTVIFLGSSVTFGYGSLGVSFADFLERTDGIISIKEAVCGTTLVDEKSSSYISRLKETDTSINAAAFVCQLSTNDATKEKPLGAVSKSFDTDSFDTLTVAGAIEYIIAYVKQTWNCPVIFYTQAKYDSPYYAKMVDLLLEIQKKWDIGVIDLWHSEKINSVTDEQKKLYLVDHIHPTKAGYYEWWLPEFQKALYSVIK